MNIYTLLIKGYLPTVNMRPPSIIITNRVDNNEGVTDVFFIKQRPLAMQRGNKDCYVYYSYNM